MKPATLQQLEVVITDAALDLLHEHQAEMARAYQELVQAQQNGHEWHRGYRAGVAEQRQLLRRLIAAESRTVNHGSQTHALLQRLAAGLEVTDG